MTKAIEIGIIDDAIKKLGPHSYLGPWLTEIRAELVSEMASDHPPNPMMPSKARSWALGFMETTKAEATKTREAADAYAAKVRSDAHETAKMIRLEARRALESLAARL